MKLLSTSDSGGTEDPGTDEPRPVASSKLSGVPATVLVEGPAPSVNASRVLPWRKVAMTRSDSSSVSETYEHMVI